MFNLIQERIETGVDGKQNAVLTSRTNHLGSFDQGTLLAMKERPGGSDKDDTIHSRLGMEGAVFDYSALGDANNLQVVDSYLQVKPDPSLIGLCQKSKITMLQAMERIDPSYRYTGDSPMAGTNALERQFIRFGYIQPPGKFNYQNSFAFSAVIANTPANQLFFPSFQSRALFWPDIVDQDLDPNMLFAGTSVSQERTFKQIKVNDSEWRHTRIPPQGIGEEAEVPTSVLSTSGYAGNMIKHGIGYAYSRDFVVHTDFNIANMAFERSRIKERIAYFNHVLATIMDGNPIYGLNTGATPVTAVSLDPMSIDGDGQLTFWAQLLLLYSLRPYKPTAFNNISSYYAYLQAAPPKNMVETEILRALTTKFGLPDMPRPSDRDFLQFTPSAKVVPDTSMATNDLLYIDTDNAIERKVYANGEFSGMDFDINHQRYKEVHTIIDGIGVLPAFRECVKILRLTVT